MGPVISALDQTDAGLGDLVAGGYGNLGFFRSKPLTDVGHITLTELGCRAPLAARISSMLNFVGVVFFGRGPAQVLGVHTPAVAAFMSRLVLWAGWGTMLLFANVSMSCDRLLPYRKRRIAVRLEAIRPAQALVLVGECDDSRRPPLPLPSNDQIGLWVAVVIPSLVVQGAPSTSFHRAIASINRAVHSISSGVLSSVFIYAQRYYKSNDIAQKAIRRMARV